jgi:hypothetical protein
LFRTVLCISGGILLLSVHVVETCINCWSLDDRWRCKTTYISKIERVNLLNIHVVPVCKILSPFFGGGRWKGKFLDDSEKPVSENVCGESNFEIRLEVLGKTEVSEDGQPQGCQY